ncbi:MAG: hypothetical protein EON60_12515 [Alphaproteobacteria bacterium]|nr:MAG: hypothetical protein EON60_12515 [Alphaproteobacteria bacterium]
MNLKIQTALMLLLAAALLFFGLFSAGLDFRLAGFCTLAAVLFVQVIIINVQQVLPQHPVRQSQPAPNPDIATAEQMANSGGGNG